MKRLLLIISLIFSLTGMLAQTSDGYLTDGDIVSISVLSDENGIKRYYLEASTDGLLTKEYATKECLWKLGITENNGNYSDSSAYYDRGNKPFKRHFKSSCHHNESIVRENREHHHEREVNKSLVIKKV